MQRLIDRIHQEQKEYLKRIEQLPPKEIIAKAYEICYREEFISILEMEEFADDELAFLLATPSLISVLYAEWLDTDGSIVQMLTDVIYTFVRG